MCIAYGIKGTKRETITQKPFLLTYHFDAGAVAAAAAGHCFILVRARSQMSRRHLHCYALTENGKKQSTDLFTEPPEKKTTIRDRQYDKEKS